MNELDILALVVPLVVIAIPIIIGIKACIEANNENKIATKEYLTQNENKPIRVCIDIPQSQVVEKVNQLPKKKLSEKLKGHIISEETRQKISKSCKGHIPPNKGIPQSDEQKRRHSEFMKGCKSPIKGKHRVWDNKELNIYHYE